MGISYIEDIVILYIYEYLYNVQSMLNGHIMTYLMKSHDGAILEPMAVVLVHWWLRFLAPLTESSPTRQASECDSDGSSSRGDGQGMVVG